MFESFTFIEMPAMRYPNHLMNFLTKYAANRDDESLFANEKYFHFRILKFFNAR